MKVAFYAPMKSPLHPVPSGDRQMARALIKSLELKGHLVEIVSEFRSFSKQPHTQKMIAQAKRESSFLAERWQDAPPDVWLCYHPYYKAPDFIFAQLQQHLIIPVFTIEASLALKRDQDKWCNSQRFVREMVTTARANFYFTDRDRAGLEIDCDTDRLINLPPFIDLAPTAQTCKRPSQTVRIVTMGMMRGGVKFDSYEMLAKALHLVGGNSWHLTIIGDGTDKGRVEQLYNGFDANQINWLGEIAPDQVSGVMAQADIFAWPGFGEAYGLCYLEAQSAGLPVIAQNTHGIPSVVIDNQTGLLTKSGSVEKYAAALNKLMDNRELTHQMGTKAQEFVRGSRNLETAGEILDKALNQWR